METPEQLREPGRQTLISPLAGLLQGAGPTVLIAGVEAETRGAFSPNSSSKGEICDRATNTSKISFHIWETQEKSGASIQSWMGISVLPSDCVFTGLLEGANELQPWELSKRGSWKKERFLSVFPCCLEVTWPLECPGSPGERTHVLSLLPLGMYEHPDAIAAERITESWFLCALCFWNLQKWSCSLPGMLHPSIENRITHPHSTGAYPAIHLSNMALCAHSWLHS